MISKITIALGLLVWLTVLGCALKPVDNNSIPSGTEQPIVASTSPRPEMTGLPYLGAGIQIQRVDWIDKYKKSVDIAAACGCDTVEFVVDARQENGSSSRIYLDMRMTPSPDQLGDLLRYAKSKGMRIVLMPIVLLDNPRGTEWRGTIKPESWSEWWTSYREMMTHFAWIAQSNGVDILVVGSELVSTEDKLEEWTRTINRIRESFKGKLTYSANWDHYSSIPFWEQLDLVAMNSYYKLGENEHVTVEEIVSRWKEIQKDQLSFCRKKDRPLLFTEVGWCSLTNAADEPWDYTKESEDIDLDLQKRLYEGFFQSWHGVKELGGFMIWEWPPDDGDETKHNRGYSPVGKPAEKVVREWLAKSWK